MNFTYMEEVIIIDAFQKSERALGICRDGLIRDVDSFMAEGYINIEGHKDIDSLKQTLMEFKNKYREQENEYDVQ